MAVARDGGGHLAGGRLLGRRIELVSSAVPNDPSLRDASLHEEWLVADPGGRALGHAALSEALLLALY